MSSPPDAIDIWAVDDDPDLLGTVRAILQMRGFAVRTFGSGQAVLEAAAADLPDLLICDVMMPGMSGITLIERLRTLPHFAAIPIVVLTAVSGEEVLMNAFDAGADDFLCKPFNVEELCSRIRSRLRTRKVVADLDQRGRDSRFLLEMSTAANESLDLRRVLGQLVQSAATALNVDRCSIILLGRFQGFGADDASVPDDRDGSCRLVAASDDLDISDVYLSIDDYPEIQQVIRTREPVIVEDVAASPLMTSVKDELHKLGVQSIVLFPMTVYDELVGVLFVRSTIERWNLNPRRRALAMTAANVAANAIRNARMYEEIVAERRRLDEALAELKETRDFLENLINASVDAIVASDISGKVILFNRAAEAILGYRAEDVVGQMDVWELYPGDGAREIMCMMRSEHFGGAGRLESTRTSLLDRDGHQVPVSISASIVYDGGRERATMGIFTDLRERLRIERELARANEDLEQTRRQMVAVELAGAAAHELNQPLTSVLGYTELLNLRMEADDPNRETVDSLLSQINRMADIVKKIGRITRYRTKTYMGDTQIVDLDSASHAVDES